jgi:hypothetical protein
MGEDFQPTEIDILELGEDIGFDDDFAWLFNPVGAPHG